MEIEAKFAVSEDLAVPDLSQIAHVHAVEQPQIFELSAVYYDTEDLALTQAKVTLRRRTGGKDAGWHVKLPAAKGRMELHAPLTPAIDGSYTPPEEILRPVKVLTRNRHLVPIAQVDNQRHDINLLDATGTIVAEFSDDHVTAWSLLPGGERTTWREWEVELGPDYTEGGAHSDQGDAVFTSAIRHLITHGATVSKSPSKLVAALGSSADSYLDPAHLADVDEDSPLHAVLVAVTRGRDRIVQLDPAVRRDDVDSVHQMRVATRALRSHLQTFDGIITGQKVKEVKRELKAMAGLLGIARDAEVVEQRFTNLLDSLPAELVTDEMNMRLVVSQRETYQTAHAEIVAYLDSDRYFALLRNLDDIIAHPEDSPEPAAAATSADATPDTAAQGTDSTPSSGAASQSSDPVDSVGEIVLAHHLHRAFDCLLEAHHTAEREWTNPTLSLAQREANYHAVRKAAKKLRYSAEAVGAATDLKTGKLYDACKQMQTVLGDFQDAVTSREVITEKAAAARAAGEDTFGFGVAYHVEMVASLDALSQYEDAIKHIHKAYAKLKKSVDKREKELRSQARRAESYSEAPQSSSAASSASAAFVRSAAISSADRASSSES